MYNKEKLQPYLFRNMVFWIGLVLSLFCVTFPFLRYLFFTVPFLVFLTILGDGKSRIGDEAKPFYAFVIAGLILSPLATSEGIKDLFLTFAGVSLALLCNLPKVKLWTLFWLLLGGAVIYFSLFGQFSSAMIFDIAKSESPFESNFGFLFGLLAPFAVMQKRYRLFFICLLLSVLCLKRIALLGAVGASAFVLIGEKKGSLVLNPLIMIFINCALVFIFLLYGNGQFDSTIQELTGQSANQFGMGRRAILALPAAEIFAHPARFFFIGYGPGSSYDLASVGMGLYSKMNLHSDLIKILYEYGLLFYMVFIGLMYSSKNYHIKVAFLFMNILFLTDNTLIYYFMLFIFVYCARVNSQRDLTDQGN